MSSSLWHENVSCWMQKLPNELLSETFRHYVRLDDPPWRLTLVCKRWQHVALTTPSLWTYITVVDGKRPKDALFDIHGPPKYSYGPSSSVCHNIGEIEDVARRAGILPLRLDVISEGPGEDGLENLAVLMNQMFSSRFVDRIEDLLINVPEWTKFRMKRNPTFYPLPSLKALEIIAIPNRWGYLLLKSIHASSAGTLRSLTLYPAVPDDLVHEAISFFTKLERLQGCPFDWPNNSTPRITVPQIMEVEVRCHYSYLTRIQLPRLQTLKIHTLSKAFAVDNGDENCQPNFPQLTDLCTVTSKSNTEWLQYVVAPKLQVLSILEVTYTREEFPSIHLLPPNLFPMVKHFTFTTSIESNGDGDSRDSLLISALRSVPNAISVSMEAGSSSRDDPKLRLQLLETLGSMEEDDILCPKLQDLELRFRTRRKGTLADYEIYLLKRIVDIRKHMGRGLAKFTVHWDQRGRIITQRYA